MAPASATTRAMPPQEELPLDPELTVDQAEALRDIEAAFEPGGLYLLTGHAGSGKTYLMQRLTKNMLAKKRSVILSAPTHKAVAVLKRKLDEAKIEGVTCRTIQSVLSLRPKPRTDRLVFERSRGAEPVTADVVVIDECSMVDGDLYRHIKRHLPNAFVLFVGDPAQLPPVGEIESQTFSTPKRSHLMTIVRQAAGNPILAAAGIIRTSQGGPADMSWCAPAALENGHGIFLPRGAANAWMKKAFTSPEFEADPDSFRYLAWTNDRVAQVNELIRSWRYGENIPTPFMPGESALFKQPLILEETMIFANNQEAKVVSIKRGMFTHEIKEANEVPKWTAAIPSWEICLNDREGNERTVHMVADNREFQKVVARIKDEAAESRLRWKHLHDFQQSLAQLQSIYALTVHKSQGSTIGTVFCDLPDIRRREETNLLEAQQMLYVAVTRPSKRLIVVGQ
jgi:exodeoxyribonuclease-5